MSESRRWVSGGAVVAVLILVAGWFLLVAPARSDASDLRSQNTQAIAANEQLRVKLTQLKAQAADLVAVEARTKELTERIPASADEPSIIRNLTSAADTAGVDLVSITHLPAVAYAAPTGAAAATSNAAALASLQAIPFTLMVSGDYTQSELFLRNLEDLKRSFLVTQFSVSYAEKDTSGKSSGTINLSVTGQVYMTATTAAPAAVTPTAAATPTAPTSD